MPLISESCLALRNGVSLPTQNPFESIAIFTALAPMSAARTQLPERPSPIWMPSASPFSKSSAPSWGSSTTSSISSRTIPFSSLSSSAMVRLNMVPKSGSRNIASNSSRLPRAVNTGRRAFSALGSRSSIPRKNMRRALSWRSAILWTSRAQGCRNSFKATIRELCNSLRGSRASPRCSKISTAARRRRPRLWTRSISCAPSCPWSPTTRLLSWALWRNSTVSNGSSRPRNQSRKWKKTRNGLPKPLRCFESPNLNFSGKFLDRIAAPDHPAFNYAAQHPPPSPHLSPQSRPDSLQLIAGRAHGADFQARLANTEFLPNLQPIHVQPARRYVLADDAGRQVHGFKCFHVNHQDLACASGSSMCAAFKAAVARRANFRHLFHRQPFFRCTKEMLYHGHIS